MGRVFHGKRVAVVMPAYNAARTLEKTYNEIPKGIADDIILNDDSSSDDTIDVARRLGLKVFVHDRNKGYGANQKTCYREALKIGADIVVMLHPDYQYPPRLIPSMVSLVTSGMFDVVLGSRILGNKALRGGMPVYKYVSNRVLTFLENNIIGEKLSEYHTGYRAYSREVLLRLPILENSDDFIFDNQILLQAFYMGFRVAEITCPSSYNKDSSSINFRRSVVYGTGVLRTACQYFLDKHGFAKFRIFDAEGRKIAITDSE